MSPETKAPWVIKEQRVTGVILVTMVRPVNKAIWATLVQMDQQGQRDRLETLENKEIRD